MKLMIPGPVDISEEVRQAMSVPSMPHYGPDWMRLFGETQELLRQVFQTHHDLYIMAGPGTMALEAALGSALEPGAKVALPYNGFFAERLESILLGLELIPVKIPAPPGQPVTGEALAAVLAKHPDIEALAVVHHETATAVLNPLEELTAVAREHGLFIVVDAVSSLGGVPLPVDAWGIDVCVSVANKALETPPALALLSISPRTWELVEARQAKRGWYLDLKTWRWYAVHWGDWHPTPVTMPTSNLYALHQSLLLLFDEGLEQRYAAYQAAMFAVRRGLEALGFEMFVPDERYASPLTTAFCPGEGRDADAMQAWLKAQGGVMISGGIGALHGKILRVGHIGLARQRDYVISFLLAVEAYLREQGESVPVGQSLVAIDRLSI